MKRVLVTLMIVAVSLLTFAQSPIGTWKTIDDNTNEATSYIEIYKKGNMLFGKITKLLDGPTDAVCDKCKGNLKNKPLIGLNIIENLKKDGKKWKGGTILDPDNGKSYSCLIELKSKDKLKVRGYIGNPMFGRTQVWHRVK